MSRLRIAASIAIGLAACRTVEARMMNERPANRLAGQKSPYLLQHRHNPVDWYPWGEEAFARARAERKPIFLSIGYSTCHWCHVMERESFEDPAIAEFLAAHFISIKVDREERPDVDRIYMTAMQTAGLGGGWPLNVFLTPELEPFFGGTYWPPEPKLGRPSLLQVLQQVARSWESRPDDLRAAAADLRRALASPAQAPSNRDVRLEPRIVEAAARTLASDYDPRHGGFGSAPKFPRPVVPAFLLQVAQGRGDAELTRKVLHTCERMAAGGIHDQIGGGFARYSVDERWLVPHFEKMLYDNAQLIALYVDAWRASRDPAHAEVARRTIAYVLRDMTDPAGGFYSAEDADSEGREGKFYCWTRAELTQLLAPGELALAVRRFGITERGNFVDHSDPDPLPGQNVLSVVDPKLTEGERALLARVEAKLLAARSRRVRPHRDDKVLASWNGLMLGALSRAHAALGEEAWRAAAERNLAFLRQALWDAPTRTLHHRWREGARDDVQLLDAYAFLLSGVIELYEATLEPDTLVFAVELAEAMIARFADPAGGFWQSPAGSPDLILRLKEDYDGAEPAGSSVAILSLLRLAAITARADLRAVATAGLTAQAGRAERLPQAVPHLLAALDRSLTEPTRIVVVGPPGDPLARALLRAAHAPYQPHKVVLGSTGPVDPFARTLPLVGGKPTAYLCTGTACKPPTQDPAAIERALGGASAGGRLP